MGLGRLIQWKRAVDHHSDGARVDLLPNPVELFASRFHDDELGPLPAKQGPGNVLYDARARDGVHIDTARCEQVLELVEVVVAEDVEDRVEAIIA